MEGESITFVKDSEGYFVTVVENTNTQTPESTKKRGKATKKGQLPDTHTKPYSRKGRSGRNNKR